MHFARTATLLVLIGCAVGAAFLSLNTSPLQPVPYGNTESSAQHLVQMVAVDGPRQAAETLNRDHKWNEVRLAITAGQPETARLLPALMPLAGPATTRSLQQAMRHTLITHPTAMLAATTEDTTTPLSTTTICSPNGMSALWRSHAQLAVSSVHDSQLAVRAKRCLDTLGSKASGS